MCFMVISGLVNLQYLIDNGNQPYRVTDSNKGDGKMFIHSKISTEIATKFNSDAADVVVYIQPNVSQDYNYASMCIWIVPGTHEEE